MARIERPGLPRRARWAVLALALTLAGCGAPPQMGNDREVFRTIDALYTAISMREAGQLDRCAATLAELNAAGRLPKAAHEVLTGYVGDARAGRWEAAQSGLREFMLGQRP